MKKTKSLLFALLIVNVGLSAKDISITGEWLLTKVEMGDKTEEVYQVVKFKDDGYAEMQGSVFGSYNYDAKAKTLTIESEMIKEFAGKWKVLKSKKKEMILESEKSRIYFVEYDQEKINLDNEKSGFLGVWKMNYDDADNYFSFNSPDKLKIITVTPGSYSTGSGTWMYDSNDQTLLMVIRGPLKGRNKVKNITESAFVLEKNGQEYSALKIDQNAKNREKPDFTPDDIYETMDKNEPNTLIENVKFSWNNPDAKISYLKNVKALHYIHSSLLKGLDSFIDEEVTANVSFDEDNYQINMDEVFDGISEAESEPDNVFFPVKFLNDYRVTGEKEITVPAGTFKCVVIEAVDSFDARYRLYMIKNRPGVYAKIILSKDDFGEEVFDKYELSEIDGDFKDQNNKEAH